MFLALVAVLLTLGLVIGVHEGGHALVAKLTGVKICRIAIGFGKPLFLWRAKSGCEWVWGRWPLGGYVDLLDTRRMPVAKNDYPKSFDKQGFWLRFLILVAGGVANALLAWLALSLLFMRGFEQDVPIVPTLTPGSIAAKAGLKPKDKILSIAGKPSPSWQEVAMNLTTALGQANVSMTGLSKEGTPKQVNVDLRALPFSNKSLFHALGFELKVKEQIKEFIPGKPWVESFGLAAAKSLHLLAFFASMLKQLFLGNISITMMLGPFGMIALSIASFAQGLSIFLYFIASLSLAVGLVNLLPFPSLDGGLILYAAIEKIRGKPISVALELLLHRLMMILFFMLLVRLLQNDLERYLLYK